MIDFCTIINEQISRLGLTTKEYIGDTGYFLPMHGHTTLGINKDGGYFMEVFDKDVSVARVYIPINPGQEITESEKERVRVQLLSAIMVHFFSKPLNNEDQV